MELEATQENVVGKLKDIATFSEEVRQYYYFKSKLWKAIQKHIESKECVILRKRSDARLAYYRGTSSVKLESVKYRRNFNIDEPPTIYLEFKVKIDYCFGSTNYFEPDYSADTVETHRLYIDPDLETNFSEKAFEKWVEKQRKEHEEEEKGKIEYSILDIIRQFGEDAKAFLQDPQKIEEVIVHAKKREKENWE